MTNPTIKNILGPTPYSLSPIPYSLVRQPGRGQLPARRLYGQAVKVISRLLTGMEGRFSFPIRPERRIGLFSPDIGKPLAISVPRASGFVLVL